jgi:phosphate transport system substrate-binding protein
VRIKYSLAAAAVMGSLALAPTAWGGSSAANSSSGSSSGTHPASAIGHSAASAVTINGAGSTFAAPIWQQFTSNLSSKGLTVNYQATGSGAGVAQLQAGTVDFAGSDPAMTDAEIKAGKGPVVHLPIALGAITVAYNLPGIKTGQIKLDGKTIADIFLGKVKTWNDRELKALNPGVKLPSSAITVVHRSDSSGTTAEFTLFLSDYSPTWSSKIGAGKIVTFPTGTGARGTAGVAAVVSQGTGSIGYVEQTYALQNGITYASVKNKAGKFVLPTAASTSAAGVGIKLPADLRISAINSPNPTAYPIAGQTFGIVYQDMCKAGVTRPVALGVKKLFAYALGSEGQAVVQKLFYARLSPPIDAAATAKLATLTCNGKRLS